MTEEKTISDRNIREINEAGKIANFFGFKPINPPRLEKQDFECVKGFDQSSHPAEKAALLRIYFEEKMMALPQPNMFYCERPFLGSRERKKTGRLESSLISLGSSKSVCECLAIQTGVAILNAIGYKNFEVQINSIGDKDSGNEFQKKLNGFMRKKGCDNSQTECTRPIDFLSETSRLHFKEVLEFLEIINIPYQINHNLIGDLDIGSETIFSVINTDTNLPAQAGEEMAFGFRFNRLAKKIGCKKDLPCVVLNISAKPKKRLKKVKAKISKPSFYLVQFGPEAKLKSFIILNELHKAGVNVIHAIAKDKLGGQIGVAETSEVPYIILIGQKEALENSVIIRNNATRSQEIVLISDLAERVKKLI